MGWFIASIYLICGAFRLARFNCLAAQAGSGGGKDFLGFPIPSAAGLVASLTLLIIHFHEHDKSLGPWNYLLAVVLVFLSAMMVSTVRYPSFKSLGLRSPSTFTKTIGAALFIGGLLILGIGCSFTCCPPFLPSISSTVLCAPASRAPGAAKSKKRMKTKRTPRTEPCRIKSAFSLPGPRAF